MFMKKAFSKRKCELGGRFSADQPKIFTLDVQNIPSSPHRLVWKAFGNRYRSSLWLWSQRSLVSIGYLWEPTSSYVPSPSSGICTWIRRDRRIFLSRCMSLGNSPWHSIEKGILEGRLLEFVLVNDSMVVALFRPDVGESFTLMVEADPAFRLSYKYDLKYFYNEWRSQGEKSKKRKRKKDPTVLYKMRL